MNPVYEKLEQCFQSVRKRTDFVPKVALVLGSGLGDYAEAVSYTHLRTARQVLW